MNEIQATALLIMITIMFGRFLLPHKLFLNKIVSHFFIPLILIILWLGLMTYQAFIIEKVFTILTVSYSRSQLTSFPSQEFYAGEKITGHFKATEDYLGIVGFKFWNFNHLNSDFVEFRIRELGQETWYYSNQYKTDQFLNNNYFTFGFPVIDNSFGKTFEFEIESTAGIPGNAVGVSQMDPIFIAKYKYPRQIVTKDTNSSLKFIGKKLMNLFMSSEYSAQSFVFLLPFLVYVIFISGVKNNFVFEYLNKYLAKINRTKNLFFLIRHIGSFCSKLAVSNKKQISLFLCYLGLLLDVLLIKYSQIPIFILAAVFTYTFLSYKVNVRWYFVSGLVCLLFSAIYNYFGTASSSERFGAWAWIFLFMWIVTQMWRLRKETSP